MKNKTILKSKSGISPILATLLLIVIAVAAIVVTYAWIMIYLHGAGQQAGVELYEANVRFYDDGSKIDIDVGNRGTSDTEILRVYMGTSQENLRDVTSNATFSPSKTLRAGEVITITLNCRWESGTTYYFKIVPKTGAHLPITKKA
ncbi:MAG: archaellin/type IV pilin N-terminal domain-containing protein [Candidatus Bathyarchaeia archaeon]